MNRKQELEAIVETAFRELNEIATAERRAQNEPLVGRCFKMRRSYYVNSPDKPWWYLYAKVVGLSDGSEPMAWTFEEDVDGRIASDVREMPSMVNWEETTEEELRDRFSTIWEEMNAQAQRAWAVGDGR